MSLLLFYDTETNGMPLWKEPSGHPGQPHIVQLAAKLIDTDTRKVIHALDMIIKPDGWNIPDEVVEIHGITTDHADRVGVPEIDAVRSLLSVWNIADRRVAHNELFDMRMVRIALKRLFDESLADDWKNYPYDCTMRTAAPICNLPKDNGRRGAKWPKLNEAYEFFTGKKLEDAHTAMADVDACIAVYFAIEERLTCQDQ